MNRKMGSPKIKQQFKLTLSNNYIKRETADKLSKTSKLRNNSKQVLIVEVLV